MDFDGYSTEKRKKRAVKIIGDNMILFVVFYVLLFNTCGALPKIQGQPNESGNYLAELTNSAISNEKLSSYHELQSRDYNMYFDGYSIEKRQKRAVKIIGTALGWISSRIINKVLVGATYVKTAGGANWYQKPGGYRKAVADFYSVKPFKVQKNSGIQGFNGTVLGRIIVVSYRLNGSNHPILSIAKGKDSPVPETIIVYLD